MTLLKDTKREVKMPEIGEIRNGKKIGYKDSGRHIWHACEICGKERWVNLKGDQPEFRLCPKCAQLGHIASPETINKMSEAEQGRKGLNAHNWKGGKTSEQGYILIKLQPNDFFYQMADRRGYVKEHRLVMAKKLGRCLQPWEIVHHKDHVKSHNNETNLKILSDIGHKQLTMLETKIDKQSNIIKDLRKDIKLLRWQIMELTKVNR